MNASTTALTNTMTTFAEVLQAFAFLIGLWLSGYALFSWYQQNKVGGQKSGGSPIAIFLTGNALMLSTVLYAYFMNTALQDNWNDSMPFGNVRFVALDAIYGSTESPMLKYLPPNTVAVMTGFIYLMGLFSYLKGIYLLRHIGSSEQGQQSGLSKAVTHIIGGMILMNLNAFSCVILGIFITSGFC